MGRILGLWAVGIGIVLPVLGRCATGHPSYGSWGSVTVRPVVEDVRVTPLEAILTVLVGLAAGILSGLFGVGGGIVMTPGLTALAGSRRSSRWPRRCP